MTLLKIYIKIRSARSMKTHKDFVILFKNKRKKEFHSLDVANLMIVKMDSVYGEIYLFFFFFIR